MPRLTVSLSDEQYEWIDREADQRDRTKSWVLRETVDAVRGSDSVFTSPMGDDDTTNHQTSSPFTTEDVDEILATLERLEERLDERPPRARSTAPVDADGPSGVEEPDAESAASRRSESNALGEVSFPSTQDREACLAAIEAARDYIRREGGASKSDLIRDVMPEHPLGYDVDAAIQKIDAGDRYRGAWWRKVVKPGLEALPDVQKPGPGGSEWR